jgi:hypothetical protein
MRLQDGLVGSRQGKKKTSGFDAGSRLFKVWSSVAASQAANEEEMIETKMHAHGSTWRRTNRSKQLEGIVGEKRSEEPANAMQQIRNRLAVAIQNVRKSRTDNESGCGY